jgi:hypothetical protein
VENIRVKEDKRKYYVLMYENGKMRHVQTIPGMGGRGDKGE